MNYRGLFTAICPIPDWPKFEPIVRLTESVRDIDYGQVREAGIKEINEVPTTKTEEECERD